ncbi:YdcF family protein [Chlorobium phaeovibrioides]|uniref:YdcF family protein n=1 Tax=Chlorobium phaeovibrioides TaxID=1094 RepID=UPI00123025CF|nr:YdcF family protein [Chlorobium phaeovibrioides]QEQ56537.1 YdcF family protein [Chlorobium phaeovibrioides]
MLMLYKILPLLLLPPGLSILLVAAGMVLHRRWLVWMGIGLLWLMSIPVAGDGLMRVLEGPGRRVAVSSIAPAEAIVVLGGMTLQIPGAPSGEWGDAADRFEAGVDLFRAGRAPLLVFTGGRLPWRENFEPEGELLRRRAVLLGVPADGVRVTGIAGNTAEEARAAARLLGPNKRIILVTSAFHMTRSLRLFRSAGFTVVPFRVDYRVQPSTRTTILSFIPDPEALLLSFTALREMMGIAWYRVLLL